tara:strand:- start:217 stop:921 length:705 start_codon:yes stop_codon:yes gene_type:complete
MIKLTDSVKKQLTKLSNAFQKNRDTLKEYVVGDRKNTFGLIGEWTAPPTYKADGTIDAAAISSGIQQDSILEYLGEAKDKDGNAKLLAAVSTVRGWINSSKPDEYKNTNQAGQPNEAREEAAEIVEKELAAINEDGINLIDATSTVQIVIEPFAKVAFDKLAKNDKLAADDVLAFTATTLRAALRLVQDQQKLQREAGKDAEADKVKADAKADAKSIEAGPAVRGKIAAKLETA